MSLALLPGTSPIVLTQRWKISRPPQLTLPVHQEKRCVFVPYVRANELLVSQLCHTLSFTHNFHARHLSHTTLSHTLFHTTFTHTIFHTQLCHTPSVFVTHHLSHTTVSHTFFFTVRSFTTSFVFPSFPVPLQHLLLIIGRS